ncbi:MAG: DUF6941 family protein [Ginsengibacter sp.]
MKINFAHVCDYAQLSVDGKLSVSGIFSQITAAAFPTQHPLLFLAFEIGLSPAELNRTFPMRIECTDADGQSIARIDTSLGIGGSARSGDRPAVPQVVQYANLVFKKDGEFSFNIWLEGRLEHQSVVTLKSVPPGGVVQGHQPPTAPPAV